MPSQDPVVAQVDTSDTATSAVTITAVAVAIPLPDNESWLVPPTAACGGHASRFFNDGCEAYGGCRAGQPPSQKASPSLSSHRV